MKITGIILAAGNSSRLGQNKQMLLFNGQRLLTKIEQELLTCCDDVCVVLGHQHKKMLPAIKSSQVVVNDLWHQGMGCSLKAGVSQVASSSDAVLVALCDQVLIPVTHYQHLVAQFKNHNSKIICSAYRNTLGVPAIFPQSSFKELLQSNDQKGAQNLIQKYQNRCIAVSCPEAQFDIDTQDDLSQLIK